MGNWWSSESETNRTGKSFSSESDNNKTEIVVHTPQQLVKDCSYFVKLILLSNHYVKNQLWQVLKNHGVPSDPSELYQHVQDIWSRKDNKSKNQIKLFEDQKELLKIPPEKEIHCENVDVTLMGILAEHFSSIPAPKNGWRDRNPPEDDISIGAFVVKAIRFRNRLNHLGPIDKITDDIFEKYWDQGEKILLGLELTDTTVDLKASIDNLRKLMTVAISEELDRQSRMIDALEIKSDSIPFTRTAMKTRKSWGLSLINRRYHSSKAKSNMTVVRVKDMSLSSLKSMSLDPGDPDLLQIIEEFTNELQWMQTN